MLAEGASAPRQRILRAGLPRQRRHPARDRLLHAWPARPAASDPGQHRALGPRCRPLSIRHLGLAVRPTRRCNIRPNGGTAICPLTASTRGRAPRSRSRPARPRHRATQAARSSAAPDPGRDKGGSHPKQARKRKARGGDGQLPARSAGPKPCPGRLGLVGFGLGLCGLRSLSFSFRFGAMPFPVCVARIKRRTSGS